MITLNPYLHFNGNTEEAFDFYKSVFGGEFVSFQRYKDMPQGSGDPGCEQISEADREKVLHAALPIGKGNVLMASDYPGSMSDTLIPGNNVSISLNTESEKETERIFKALSAGGDIKMPLQKTFWNAYFGMVTDKFGIQWMINYDYGQQK
jgi:PhnB protein